ncbi:MAG: glycosyltransferase family 1 protein [Hyphomicrobiales bacterium]|nr:glycosyltransferase family 1 protein [Hyphomicrobiales bacterium]
MKIALVTLGTRGDVQPFIALGKGLMARGHDVLIGAPDEFKSWIEGHGLAYQSIGVDMRSFVQSPEGREVMGGSVFAVARMWSKSIKPLTRRSLDAIWKTARSADAIVYHPKTAGAADVGEATGAALFYAAPFPVFPTTAFPLFVFPGNYGSTLNPFSYKVLLLPRLFFLPTVNAWREDVLKLHRLSPLEALNEARSDPAVQLCAVSPTVVPGYPASEAECIQTTGYWFLDEGQDWVPDPALSAFLEDGDPPIYIGFGSMTTGDPSSLAHIVVEGVRRAGVRAILATGWGALAEINVPRTVHVIKGAPHIALFRHVSAVVHHGGAGTTAAGLRAGLPTLICPLAVDQPFWGRRVLSLGCGPKPQPIKRLQRRQFAEGLTELVRTESYRHCAQEVATAIAEENGVERAVEIIETVSQKRAAT